MSLIYEGKAKRLFTTEDPNELLMEFKDDATAFNGAKKESFPNKGGSIVLELHQKFVRILGGEEPFCLAFVNQ